MAHWFHRNPLKATSVSNFELKLVTADTQAIHLCSELRSARSALLNLLPDPNESCSAIEGALRKYLELFVGFIEMPDQDYGLGDKLRWSLRFRWTNSMLGSAPEARNDAMFEAASIILNVAMWYMKCAARIAAKEAITMDEAKVVHSTLRKASGLFHFVESDMIRHLRGTNAIPGSDLDPRAYNYAGEKLLSDDKGGLAVRSLRESQKKIAEATEACKLYSKVKGVGTTTVAKPVQHIFFRNLNSRITRTLEKCERENGLIYHEKIPYDPPELELKATYGLVAPEAFILPPVSPLWTPFVYRAVDISKIAPNEKPAKPEANIEPVKEVPVDVNSKDPQNESGCVLT
ncbi:unnamed protein product [Notodromas monacha]|uniref:BRO1 domain-containing protein n=1 Tax=Notodromas monacha TaxID=399045 RepID=A0A7R9BF58_9CRUS|nr:unnamed protein product [Notodromas monacha]CAG0914263.1 unnamed protein product [Notodromas monacha]